METELNGKIALVTGAGQGIGRAIALALAAHGATVVVNDVKREKADKVVAEIVASGSKAVAACADVSQRDAVDSMVGGIVKQFGRLDILVNGARVEPPRPAGMSPEDWWDRVLDVDLKGSWLCSMAALEPMKRQQFGRIINISSIQGYMGNAEEEWIAYSCAKAGMGGLTRSLAQAGLKLGITANAIAPDYIETEVMEARWGRETMREYAASVPIGRAGRPEEVAEAVLFLVKSGFITGETIFITGGRFVISK
ncbi:MAG: SDR family NAD(P)-dependent oxidoreductase [Verrucomicrobia bacterium]|nr:SDR family NAD(P)-dependent oxidoreductase [Verrucomicrobiota bacterium]